MRILHIGYMFTIGGAETMLVDIINRQVEFAEVALCIINDRINYSLLDKVDKRVEKILIKRKAKSLNPFKFLELNLAINHYRPDIIHSHHDIIAKVLPFVSIPKILTVHDVGVNLQCVNKYKMICSISKSVQNDLLSRMNIGSELVYNGIDIQSIKKNKFISRDLKTFRILQISRLMHEKKGQDILIQVLYLLRKEFKDIDFHLDFIGTGPSEEYLHKLCLEYGLENNVHFLGEKDRKYIYDSISEYHLLVQPSRYEGFGLTVIEGIAAKIPVLSSTNDGPEEILKSGEYGFLFENGNVQSCYLQLKNIYSQYNSLQPMIDKAYRHISENFDINQTVQTYLEKYKKILNS